jgi:hypothetical protein
MDVTRSYLVAGAAAVSAAALAVSPVQPLAGNAAVPAHHASALAVELAATFDPFTPLVNLLDNTADNLSNLIGTFAANPFPITQQIALNQLTYFSELPDFGTIFSQIVDNIRNGFGVPFEQSKDFINPVESGEIVGFLEGPLDHYTFYALATTPDFGVVTPEEAAQIKPIFDALTAPITGVVLGLVGPILGPVLSVVDSVGAIIDALGDADFISALNELINIPTNAINALLNGGPVLDLAPVVGLLGVELPAFIQSIGLTMGGLLSPGAWSQPDRGAGLPETGPGVAFDAFGTVADTSFGVATLNGLPVGPIGSLIGLNNTIAQAIVATPPAPGAATPAAAEAAPAVEAVGTPEASAVVVEAPAVEAPLELAVDESAENTPAPAPKRSRAAAGSDNSGNENATRASGRGMAKSASARGAN